MSNIFSRTIWTTIKVKLLAGLYETQISSWNLKLAKLIQTNANLHGVVISEAVAARSAIQFNNASRTCLAVSWMSTPIVPEYHFMLMEGHPQMKTDLEQIAEELAKIERERYETDRFLSGLSMYYPTRAILQDTLGDSLFLLISKVVKGLNVERTDILQIQSLEEFIQFNRHILAHMQERVLVNLIMSDIVSDVATNK